MRLSTERHYRFPGDVATVWTALAATGEYQQWWPWLRHFDARGLFTGDAWTCLVKPPLPYSLRFTVQLDDVAEHRSVAATIAGDIAGVARLELTPRDEICEIRLTSELAPRSRAFAMFAALARPLVKRGHDWVLDTGAAQFAASAVGDRPRPQR